MVQGKAHAEELCIHDGMQGLQLCHKLHIPKRTLGIIKEGHCTVLLFEDGAIPEDPHAISSCSLEGANLCRCCLSLKKPDLQLQ